MTCFPSQRPLRTLLLHVKAEDEQKVFSRPIPRQKEPAFYNACGNPLDLWAIEGKLDRMEYTEASFLVRYRFTSHPFSTCYSHFNSL